ncbi:MAG: 6-carboxytetrahydropterin synthase [Myxococcales bacterium]|nr:6-carboxytetrahydropterin synthase [Myxococcales bacterium]
MATHRIQIRHNVELAHRLADQAAPDKCRSIHGHSWWVTVTIAGEALDAQGMLVEFGAFKAAWRGFLNGQVDHHLALQQDDPFVAALRAVMPEARLLLLPFEPTTENLARWLYERADACLSQVLRQADAPAEPPPRVQKLHLQETAVNAAEYEP